MLTRYRRQNVEGAHLLVGERWDARSQLWLPCYPDLIAHPRPRRLGGACCSAWKTPAPTLPSTAAATATAAAAATTACSPEACSAPAAIRPRASRQHPLRPGAACRAAPASREMTPQPDQRRPQRRKHHETLTP